MVRVYFLYNVTIFDDDTTMPSIQRLSPHEAQKIAAGQVVERPANIVKELIENSLDACATQITIYVHDGGKQLIRIVDNGVGMDLIDARLCIEHHTTSKISSINDLQTIATFGFRGEALSSICAVSKVVLVTKKDAADEGIRLDIQTGKLIAESVIATNTGTDITITDLFFNVPARKKFLKKRETELHQIQQIVQAFCLAYRSISFKLFHDDRQLINCPASENIINRIAQLFDHPLANSMIPFETAKKDIALTGAISNHHYVRYDRNHIFMFVNKRWIKNYELSRALLKGYMNVLPPARYPAAIVDITVDPSTLDINIHPRKEEVRFLHPRIVEAALQEAVTTALENHLSSHLKRPLKTDADHVLTFSSMINSQPTILPHHQPMRHTTKETAQEYPSHAHYAEIPAPISLTDSANGLSTAVEKFLENEAPPVEPIETNLVTHQQYAIPTVIGQFHTTYILLDQGDGLFVIDQHAAHERILYEQFAARFSDIPTIPLLFPQIITLTSQETETIAPHLTFFGLHGIMLDIFSDHQLLLQATPVHLKNQSIDDLIRSMIGWINEFATLDTEHFAKIIHEKLRAQMACKAAVKAGDILTMEQMQQLINDLYTTNNRFSCPHGRPTGWLLPLHEFEKKFKRRL